MEDREKFIAEFNKIVQETAKDYPPEDREVKALHSLFDEIILSWDIDVRDHGIGKQIKYFEKNAKKTDKALNKQKEIIHEWGDIKRDKAGNVLLPDNNPQYVSRVSMAFFLSALLKMDHFIIEYLEGLKSKPVESLVKGITTKPKLIGWQAALIAFYKGDPCKKGVENETLKALGIGGFSANSLNNHYCKIQKNNNRTGSDGSSIKDENKIKRMEAVLPYLNDTEKQQANRDIQTMKKNAIK
jgi:hypothetical protein